MRHLWSLLAGVVAAPLTWILITLGQDGSVRTITNWVDVGTFNTANLIEPAVYLAVAGILLGLVGTLRISPLGPLVAGLLLITPYAGLFADPFTVRDRVPTTWKVLGDPLPLRLPVENGTLFLIGVVLVMATFSVQRWRRWPRPAGPVVDSPPVDHDPDRTDWPPLLTSRDDAADNAPMSLGYPDPAPPPAPAPRRDGESPWSAPPRSSARRDGTWD
jgi:hypothetical protein